MNRRGVLAAIGIVSLLAAGCAGTGAGTGPDKVVYHINLGDEQASDGLRNIRNHLQANPSARIVVVTHSRGINFLRKGSKDKSGNQYIDQVERLKLGNGVRFEVCEIAMTSNKLTKADFIEYATFVPSGVAEITRLQRSEGYAYLKP